MLRFPAVNANKLRVRIDECRLTAYVSQVAAYYAEPLQEETTKEDWNNLPPFRMETGCCFSINRLIWGRR